MCGKSQAEGGHVRPGGSENSSLLTNVMQVFDMEVGILEGSFTIIIIHSISMCRIYSIIYFLW